VVKPLPGRPASWPGGGAAKASERIAGLPVRLRTHGASLRPGADAAGPGEDRIRAVYLERGEKATGGPKDARALVAADADAVTLTPDGGAALYRTRDGALYAAPIEKQGAEAFLSARRESWKAQTVSNAKQAGLAILMYTQDYDETFPPAGDITGIVNPYVKMPEVFQNPETGQAGFTYVHPGAATISGVKSVQTTVLGYLAGPGGRAVIYVDGHVEWEEQK